MARGRRKAEGDTKPAGDCGTSAELVVLGALAITVGFIIGGALLSMGAAAAVSALPRIR